MSSFTNMTFFTYTVLFITACQNSALIKLPGLIEPCNPKNTECLKNLLQELRPHLIQGIPKLNLPPIDPLYLPNYNQSNPFSSKLSYFATISDLPYTGLSDFNVSKLEIDLDNCRFLMKIKFPKVVASGNEVVSVDGFGIKAEGEGPVKATFNNLTLGFSLFGSERFQDGRKHLSWKEDVIIVRFDGKVYDVHPSFKRGRDNYQRIFNKGNADHPEILDPEVQRIVKNTLAKFIFESLNFVHKTYPIDALYVIN